jgi:hypothetical protein
MSVTLDRVLDWILDLLTTYTYNLELQLITAPSLISTLYSSLEHTVSCSQSVSRRFLVMASNRGCTSAFGLKSSLNCGSLPPASFLHRLPYRTDLVAPVVFLITPRHGPHRQHCSFLYANHFCMNVFTELFPSTGCLFLLVKNLLPSKRCFSTVSFTAVA